MRAGKDQTALPPEWTQDCLLPCLLYSRAAQNHQLIGDGHFSVKFRRNILKCSSGVQRQDTCWEVHMIQTASESASWGQASLRFFLLFLTFIQHFSTVPPHDPQLQRKRAASLSFSCSKRVGLQEFDIKSAPQLEKIPKNTSNLFQLTFLLFFFGQGNFRYIPMRNVL